MEKTRLASATLRLFVTAAPLLFSLIPAHAQERATPLGMEDATLLSAFGERPSFSPDGTRLAFIGKAYGDAYEIEIGSGKVRNLTGHLPHQGILRIQYLPNGDYLITAPARHIGANSRARLEMWIMDRRLERVLQPLGERPFEGIAVSRTQNRIAWTAIEPEPAFSPGENWRQAFARPTKRYVAEITYENGRARIANKKEIMRRLPRECIFAEPQDFRAQDNEILFSCLGTTPGGGPLVSVMGYKIDSDTYVTYRRQLGEYNEIEGAAADGGWTTVECGVQNGPALPPLDICRLELRPNGSIRRLIRGTEPGSTRHISNPVVSPDGRWIAFQSGDSTVGEEGEGTGVYQIKIP